MFSLPKSPPPVLVLVVLAVLEDPNKPPLVPVPVVLLWVFVFPPKRPPPVEAGGLPKRPPVFPVVLDEDPKRPPEVVDG